MFLVQILLPLFDNDGTPFERSLYRQVRDELTERCGGLTSYTRSPARGVWCDKDDEAVQDDIVIYEVMVEQLDRAWWAAYREQLRRRFRQEALVVRASVIELL